MRSHIDVFTNIYETCLWGNNNDPNYKGSSGGGSSIECNKDAYIPFVKDFINQHNIKNVIDLGCGDFRCGMYIYDDLNVHYTGYDAYCKVIENNKNKYPSDKFSFYNLDLYNKKEEILSGDLCILKDVLQHWNSEEIYNFMDYITSSGKFKYILLCNCCDQSYNDRELNSEQFGPLSCEQFPLKKYNPKRLFKYDTKEVSLIEL